ncbi:MAG: phosphorylase [Candidatus Aquicultor secundus]|uniref:Phosphorylase n=1 Tax=Candidatus Aquicultor secundus TaxID=1973895 RepID=A0A2M7T7U5_9ACTN|nr:MTAP family purine nucleoside phosphorylase [Candidatus Aquicultor secundus]OIO86619.1 MAG: hypothetical protein AUK32_05190 [Candidatus Aquicultor secundus]PIU27167.1 MAG: phosphorylase [Candidatus Aquicultor secundus]PIW22271.1 MAG: phosphorylase [Candidatus Aquicultor secundus]PIX51529.1 MAG: phosphorylase [Candidatus Aquicultor secundus]PIY41179.1 MAG: phosphorylase [Candidatus Aquicultor secundus]
MIGVITGSGLYKLKDLELKEEKTITTPFGEAEVSLGSIDGKDVAFIARHGRNHELLPNMINYRANIFALKETGVCAIIATSVMGVVDRLLGLGRVILFDDLYFPENRLPNGEICTMFTAPGGPERAHYIFSSPFSSYIRGLAAKAAADLNINHLDGGTYGHVNGPRFNSKAEIRSLQSARVTAISQTCGPEAVLSGELEIPYQLIGFGVDYANGVSPKPTPIEVLDSNLSLAATVLPKLIKHTIQSLNLDEIGFDGILYKFE